MSLMFARLLSFSTSELFQGGGREQKNIGHSLFSFIARYAETAAEHVIYMTEVKNQLAFARQVYVFHSYVFLIFTCFD